MRVFNGKKFVPLDKVLEQPEIMGLREDLGLELVRASRYHKLFEDCRFKVQGLPCPQILDSQKVIELEKPFLARYMERNHHRKVFKDVYKSDNNQAQLSFDW